MEESDLRKRLSDKSYELERMRDFLNWLEEKYLETSIGQYFEEFIKWEQTKKGDTE